MKKNVLSVALLMVSGFTFAQVGIGTANPNASALLDIEAKTGSFKGVLIPRIPLRSVGDNTTIDGKNTPNSLLIFNTTDNADLKPGYYYWFGTSWVRLISSSDEILSQLAINEELAVNVEEQSLYLRDTKQNVVSVPLADINILTSLVSNGEGQYTYISENETETTIDVVADVIHNIALVINDENVINEIIQSITAHAKPLTGDDSIEVIGGEKAVLTPTTLRIKEASISNDKIAPGGNKQLLVTDGNGAVNWVDASDAIIKDAVTHNETITLLVDGGDGTFTYYNEKGIDADGNTISGRGVTFDANTLRIVKNDENKYEFYDKTSDTTPIATIDVAGSVIENITEILNNTEVQQNIYEAVAAQGKAATASDGSILVTNGEQAVLHEMQLSVANQGITTTKIAPGGQKQLLVTDENGVVNWVDASDAIIQDAVTHNETITLLVDGGDGTFTYYNEKGIDADGNVIPGQGIKFDANTLRIKEREGATGKGIFDFYDGMTSPTDPLMTISTRANAIVFENNSTVVQGDNVQEIMDSIIQKIEQAHGTTSSLKGNGILVNGQGEVTHAVLKEVTLTLDDNAVVESKIKDGAVSSHKVRNKAVTTEKIKGGLNKQLLVTKENDVVTWVDASDAIIKDAVTHNETITLLVDGGDGTFTYYNEKGIDADGNTISGRGVTFDANTLRIDKNDENKYEFYDKTSDTTPIATIDVAGSVIENITEILNNTDVQQNIYQTVAAQGKAATASDGSILVANGEQAVLSEMQLSVANQGITTAKIAPGGQKQLLVTNENGTVTWADASDTVIQEIVAQNEVVTILVDEGDGSFTYYNEKGIDADGNVMPGQGVKFDANTLRIVKNIENKYEFYDKTSDTTPIATIDVAESVIENITEILNNTDVQQNIYQTVAAQGKAATASDGSILVANGEQAVLSEMQLSVANQGITTAKIAPGGQKQLLVTNENGAVTWADASDIVIQEIVAQNEVVTLLVDEGDGTFTYYNEKDIDANGNAIAGRGVTFDANTLKIVEIDQNKYEFYDKTSDTAPIATIDVAESVIANITEILNSEEVQNQLFASVAAKGKNMNSTDGSIAITGGTKSTLNNVVLNISEGGVTTSKIKDKAVTVAKIGAENAVKGSLLTADGLGNVAFQTASEGVKPAMQGDLVGEEDVITVTGGENVLFGDPSKEVVISINPGGIVNDHLGNQTVKAEKFDATGAVAGTVATVNADGTVSYQAITPAAITSKGDLTTDGVLTVDQGEGKVLGDVKIGLKDKAVTAAKLDATGETKGNVAMVNADGTVSYQAISANELAAKGDITTDQIIKVDNGTGKVLADVSLSIEDKSITAAQLADHTIGNDQVAVNSLTIDKLSPGNEPAKRVLVIDEDRNIKWGELDDLVTDAAGNLTTDDIIEITTGDGVNSLFNDVGLGIKTGSITNDKIQDKTIEIGKLSDAGSAESGMVMVTDGQGGFVYVDKETIVNTGEDLTLEESLKFMQGNGRSAVLADTKIGIQEGGITTPKLADGAVTTAKISANGAVENAVLTANADGTVAYKKINDAAFEGTAADLKSDGSLLIPSDNKAVLKETTIAIATEGVEGKHLASKAVTTDKIDAATASNGAVLTADGAGNAVFKTLEEVADIQGEAISSSDQSLVFPEGNKATLQAIDAKVAPSGIKNTHLAARAVTEDKIGTNKPEGLVLTSDGSGGATFKSLGQVIGNQGKSIVGQAGIDVIGGEHAVLKDVEIAIADGGITTAKLADNAVGTSHIKNQAVTAAKIIGEGADKLLGTNASGEVAWLDAENSTLTNIIQISESVTVLRDNENGTFTYYNEKEVDKNGNVIANATGVSFDANTLEIIKTTDNKYAFYDQSSSDPIAVLDIAASVVENITEILNNTTVKEQINQIVVAEGKTMTQADSSITVVGGEGATLKDVQIAVANEGVTTDKIAPGSVGQLLVTDETGNVAWVSATNDIVETIINAHQTVTILRDNEDGTLTYFNESDIDKNGNFIGTGVTFNANTLRIDTDTPGVYIFYDQTQVEPIATIDIAGTVIENITEILSNTTVQNDIYQVVKAQGKNVTGDEAIVVAGGQEAALNEMQISLKNEGVTTQKIKKLAVTEDRLFAGYGKENFIPVAQGDGTVKYQAMAAVMDGKELSVDGSLEVTGEADTAVLAPLSLKVKEGGIANEHIQTLAITSDKISSHGIESGAVMAADGSGNVVFKQAEEAIAPSMNGDLVGDDAIVVLEGSNVLFGDENKVVAIGIKTGGVKGSHIAAETVENLNIKSGTIEASKLTGGSGPVNRVAITGENGIVTYQTLAPNMIGNKGKISTDGIIAVSDNGVDKVLADVTLSIADTSIKSGKLHGGGAAPNTVAMVGANGNNVSYEFITPAKITSKGNMTTDGVITLSNSGTGAVLSDVKLGIKNKGITTTQLADKAVQNGQLDDKSVTVDKMSAEGVTAASMLVTHGDGSVTWAELGDVVSETAGDLTTDSIIEITTGDGEKALLKDITLGIASNSITKDKLSSIDNGQTQGRDFLLVTDGAGGFDYVAKEGVLAGGEDLELEPTLVFTGNTTGFNTVLTPTKIGVADQGIGTAQLATAAVTTEKISAEGAAANSVITANEDGTVSFKSLSNTAFEGQGKNLVGDESMVVTADNKALLADVSIGIALGGVETKHLKDKAVKPEKISGTVGANNAGAGSLLTADGQGATIFQSLETIATTQGKPILSDGSLTIAENKAALKELNISVAPAGIKNNHIEARNVTADKIGSEDKSEGHVLITDGQGGALFTDMADALSNAGTELRGGRGIMIAGSGASHAVLADVQVNIQDSGVGELQLAANAVTVTKIAAKSVTPEKISSIGSNSTAVAGLVLTADGRGGASYKPVAASATLDGKIYEENSPISVNDGANSVGHDVKLGLKMNSIGEDHLKNGSVTTSKIAAKAVDTGELADLAVTSSKIDYEAVGTAELADLAVTTSKIDYEAVGTTELADEAVTTEKIADDAVGYDQLKNSAVYDNVIKNKGVKAIKINPDGAPAGSVLTALANGNAEFRVPSGANVETYDLKNDGTIEVTNGEDAVLNNVKLGIALKGVDTRHLDNKAVTTEKIDDKAITEGKISSKDGDGYSITEGYVLTADGRGGASFKPAPTGGDEPGPEPNPSGVSMPKFFYAPSFIIAVVPGQTNIEVDVYDYYEKQFGTPKAVNPNAQNATLPVLAKNKLDYYVLFYDDTVFSDVTIDNDGRLKYSVKRGVQVETNSFVNIMFGVRE